MDSAFNYLIMNYSFEINYGNWYSGIKAYSQSYISTYKKFGVLSAHYFL